MSDFQIMAWGGAEDFKGEVKNAVDGVEVRIKPYLHVQGSINENKEPHPSKNETSTYTDVKLKLHSATKCWNSFYHRIQTEIKQNEPKMYSFTTLIFLFLFL